MKCSKCNSILRVKSSWYEGDIFKRNRKCDGCDYSITTAEIPNISYKRLLEFKDTLGKALKRLQR